MKPNGVVSEAEKDEEFYVYRLRTKENMFLYEEKGWIKVKWTGHTWVPEGLFERIYDLYHIEEDKYWCFSPNDPAYFPRKEKK